MTTSHRNRLRFFALAVTTVLLGGLFVAAHPDPAAAEDRPVANTPLLTWNMQGANESGPNNNKWQNTVREYALHYPIIMLQEAGAGPADSTYFPETISRTTTDENGNSHTHDIKRFFWDVVTESRAEIRIVYFLHTQNGVGGRVNLAMVVDGEPDEVNVVANPRTSGRTALGVRYGNNWYFTVHGLSSRNHNSNWGGDSATLLDAIDTQVDRWAREEDREYHWTVGGDFNREPRQLGGDDDFPVAHILGTGEATHNAGRELDYFVTDDFSTPRDLRAYIAGGPPSDHRPVGMRLLQQSGEVPSSTRVMAIGDSLQQGLGSTNESGSRDEVQDGLGTMTTGQVFGTPDTEVMFDSLEKRDFVGERQHGSGIPDRDHEGWPGYTIDQIAQEASDAVPSMRPTIVTLLAGTNDMVRNVDVANAPARLSRLIDQIFQGSPGVAIVVGTLTPSRDAAYQARINAYNQAVRKMLDDRITDGDHLVRVDLGAVSTADLADVVHPTDAGYRKMADAFLEGIRTALANGWVRSPGPVSQPGGCLARGGYEARGKIWGGLPGSPDVDQAMKYPDLDGDGRDDMVWISPTGAATAWLNRDGNAFNWVYRGEIAMGTGFGPDRVFFADMNADRKDDYIVVKPDNVVDVYYNRGGDTVGTDGWKAGFQAHLNHARGTDTPVGRIRFADIDADGRADYIRLLDFNTKVEVFYNRGGDMPGRNGWDPGGNILTNLPSRTNTQIEFADLNCDRRADYIALDSKGVPTAWLNTNRADWSSRGQIATGTGGVIALPDLNDDGRADWVKIGRDGAIDAWLNKGGD